MPTVAAACDPKVQQYKPFVVVPDPTDTTPPTAATARVEIDDFGLLIQMLACPPTVNIGVLLLGAQDDRTPADQLGWRFEVIDGEPSGREIKGLTENGLVLMPSEGLMIRAAPDEFRYTLAATPVDAAGNEGPTTEIEIYYHGRGGWRVFGVVSLLLLTPFVAVGVIVGRELLRRRRERVRS